MSKYISEVIVELWIELDFKILRKLFKKKLGQYINQIKILIFGLFITQTDICVWNH